MLPFRRLAPVFKCLFSVSRPITSSVHRRAELSSSEDQEPFEEGQEDEDMLTQRDKGPASYKQFLEDIGHQYKFSKPQQWLGKRPFPMNPSFKPPPPISDNQREIIYRLYWLNPKRYNVRKLSKIFNISLKRITAILRLKALEKSWIKEGKELQTGFLFGMERLLNVQTHNAVQPFQDYLYLNGKKDDYPDRSDVFKADHIEQKEKRDLVKVQFEQLYWEAMPEDSREPILPLSLQEAQKAAISKTKRKEAKANAKFMHRIPDTEFIKTPTYKVMTLTRESRPTTRFVNVGSAFMNAHDLAKRQVASQRKSRMRNSTIRAKRMSKMRVSGVLWISAKRESSTSRVSHKSWLREKRESRRRANRKRVQTWKARTNPPKVGT